MLPLLFDSLIFSWIAVIATFVIFGWCVIRQEIVVPIITIFFVLVLYQNASTWHPYSWLLSNWLIIVGATLIYIVVGMIWSVFKWYEFCVKSLNNFLRNKEITQTSSAIPPRASLHKEQILSWMIYWPFSVVVFVFFDALREIFVGIYNKVTGILQRISNHVYRNVM